jgi:hypothetical protein
MKNEQWDDSDAELYTGSFGGVFALIVLVAAIVVLLFF